MGHTTELKVIGLLVLFFLCDLIVHRFFSQKTIEMISVLFSAVKSTDRSVGLIN